MKYLPLSKLKFGLILTISLLLVACGSARKQGGYYQDDGPGSQNVNIDSIPNAVPKPEPYYEPAFNSYTVNGKRYVPLRSAAGFLEEGNASWYGKKYHGRKTSTGEVYDMYKMTAAHPTLPLPSYVRVTNAVNQRSVIVRVNDRGPFLGNRIIDLSYVAAQKLGVVSAGTGRVIVEAISPQEQQSITSSPLVSNQNQLIQQPVQNPSVVAVGEIPAGQAVTPIQNSVPTPKSQRDPGNTQVSGNTQTNASPQLVQKQVAQRQETQNQLLPQGADNNGQASNPVPQLVQQNGTSAQTPPPPSTPNLSQQLWLQVGAFSVMKNAQELLQRLRVSGYQNAQITQNANLFKVVVGPVSQQQLATTQQNLKSNGYPAFVAKL